MKKPTNKSIGNSFENEVVEWFGKLGFWAHNFTQNASGQPTDIVIANKKFATIIDAKVCHSDRFVFDRMEDNQILAMTRWLDTVGTMPYFIIKFAKTEKVYMCEYVTLSIMENRLKKESMNESEIAEYFPTLGEWILENESYII